MKAICLSLLSIFGLLGSCLCQDTIRLQNRQFNDNYRDEDIAVVVHKPNDSLYYVTQKLDTVAFVKFIASDLALVLKYRKSGITKIWVSTYKDDVIREIGQFSFSKKSPIKVKKIGTWLFFSEQGKLLKEVYYDKEGS